MPTIINKNVIEIPNSKSSNAILLDTAGTDLETSYPNGVYAILTYPVGDISSSPSLSSTTVLENTAYQDTPFNLQKNVTSSATQITSNNKKGWVTLTIESGDIVYIGDSGVTTANGYKLNDSNPSVTISSDDLSEWYVIGDVGSETLFVIGAYIN